MSRFAPIPGLALLAFLLAGCFAAYSETGMKVAAGGNWAAYRRTDINSGSGYCVVRFDDVKPAFEIYTEREGLVSYRLYTTEPLDSGRESAGDIDPFHTLPVRIGDEELQFRVFSGYGDHASLDPGFDYSHRIDRRPEAEAEIIAQYKAYSARLLTALTSGEQVTILRPNGTAITQFRVADGGLLRTVLKVCM